VLAERDFCWSKACMRLLFGKLRVKVALGETEEVWVPTIRVEVQ
jgi:hypothetical protein